MKIYNLIKDIKGLSREKIIWYLRLLGIIISSLMVAVSFFYLITNLSCGGLYAPFLIFGVIFVFLLAKKKKQEKIKENWDKSKQKLFKKIEEKKKLNYSERHKSFSI